MVLAVLDVGGGEGGYMVLRVVGGDGVAAAVCVLLWFSTFRVLDYLFLSLRASPSVCPSLTVCLFCSSCVSLSVLQDSAEERVGGGGENQG